MFTRKNKKPLSESQMLVVYFEDKNGRQVSSWEASCKVKAIIDNEGKVVEKIFTPVENNNESKV